NHLQAELIGVTRLPEIGGVIVRDEQAEILASEGMITDGKIRPVTRNTEPKQTESGDKAFSFTGDVYYEYREERKHIGTLTLIAEPDAVFNRVILSFSILVINAILKTVALWLIFLFFSRRLLHHPLSQLIQAVEQFNPEAKAPPPWVKLNIGGQNELTQLRDTYCDLTARLHRSQSDLMMLNEDLENRVKERTKELKEANAELKKAYARLNETSTTDPLTGWRNRRFISEHLDSDTAIIARTYQEWMTNHIQHPPPFLSDLVFYMIDLDHFKSINDSYGHEAGDEVLRQFCANLSTLFRKSDYLVRWGGEEFLVIARFVDHNQAGQMAERICETVAGLDFNIGNGYNLQRTCSVGYACYPFNTFHPDAYGWTDIVNFADRAMYLAKTNGRNGWVGIRYSPQCQTIHDPSLIVEQTLDLVNNQDLFLQTGKSLPHGSINA
ncbi:MAG: diguanylate cyclase, partial [Pseudomonadales bacterium]|nr:diguanylate cyclase [Pseudomonadales bacterium]